MDIEEIKKANSERVTKISKKTETVLQLADKLEKLADQLENSGLSKIADRLEVFNEKLSEMPSEIAGMQSVSDAKLNAWIKQVEKAITSIELNPQFQVDAPNVNVQAPGVDLSPITSLVSGIEQSISKAVGSIKMPEQEDRTDELKEAVESVKEAIDNLVFPVAEHPLPFKDANGKPTQVQLDADGNVPTTATLSGTATLSNVSGSASSVTILASNTARTGATIQNDSSAILYVKFGATASTTSYTIKMAADSYYEVPFGYTGVIDGIWASATGSARVTEMS